MTIPIFRFFVLFSVNIFFLTSFSCGEDSKKNEDTIEENSGIRIKYFSSPEAIESEIKSFLKPGFVLSADSAIEEFGNYHSGIGSYEYRCSWGKPRQSEIQSKYKEWITVRGQDAFGWDINDDHEKTTKAEIVKDQKNDGWNQIMDARLDKLPYKNNLLVFKNQDNIKGQWDFIAYTDPTDKIDGDGQYISLSGTLIARREDKAKYAEYNLPTDEEAVTIFIKLVEEVKEKKGTYY